MKKKVVLDTDTFNEIDDQFALAYLLKSEEEVEVKAIYAAPFYNQRSSGAKDGMEKSFVEIGKLLERMKMKNIPHFKGSTYFLTDKFKPEKNEAVLNLINQVKKLEKDEKLYIIAIGAITNIASAILLDSSIEEKCSLIWLGGHSLYYPHNKEFNLCGDIKAVQIVFNSKIDLTVVPCLGVASHLTSSREELSTYLNLENPLCNFLYNRFNDYIPEGMGTKEIWDVAAVAALIKKDSIKYFKIARPKISEDGSYIIDLRREPMKFIYELDRDNIYKDLYNKLNK